MKKKKVLVGLSGGLDSTMAAFLLKQEGYEVIGVHFQLWHDDKAEKLGKNLPENKCCSLRDLMLARTVAKQLDIPFFVFDFREKFRKSVVEKFLAGFAKGKTPNPCVECNRSVKFGFFLDKMKELGCDFVATGHYVLQNWNAEKNRWEISAGKDTKKDQTYFLYTLNQKRLAHTLFPMGNFSKDEIREMAKENGFEIFAQKRESQGVCFYAEASHLPFLKRQIPSAFAKGEIWDVQKNEKVGEHDGILHFTRGQRARVSGMLMPKYVISTDVEKNIVWIGEENLLFVHEIWVENLSFVMEKIEEGEKIFVRIRHGGQIFSASFSFQNAEKGEKFGNSDNFENAEPSAPKEKDESRGRILLENPMRSPSSGQSCVFFDTNGVLLGGGIIE